MATPNNTVVITAKTGFDTQRLKNFYITNGLQGFGWMLFHFSVVYFFTILLDSVTLVGIFLGLANFVAFLLDIPLGILQRYISTKKFFILGAISQLVAIGIFFVLILKVLSLLQVAGNTISPEFLKSTSDWFFGNALIWLSLIVAAVCYGLTKEINDVSTFGYILSNSSPSEYGVILSRSNITFGIGSLIGLLLSGVLLSLNNFIALIILGVVIVGFMFFTIKYFDNSAESISMQDIKEFTISLERLNMENVKEKISETIKNTDLQKVVTSTKYLFLKPKQITPETKIPWREVVASTKKEFAIIWGILSHIPVYYGLIWGLTLVLIFGFWDTFASSFLIDYLNQVKQGGGYILLALIGVPGIVLQEYAIKLADKIGAKTVGIIGLALSGISLVIMGIMATGALPSAFSIIAIALVNSLGYACGMAIGQNAFLDIYNKIYAEHENLSEINANASAGPMKVVQNLANVIGLVLGGFLVAFGFNIFFFIFAFIILGVLGWTLMKKKEIQV